MVDSGAHRAFAAQHWVAYGPRDDSSATNFGPMGAAVPWRSARPRPDLTCRMSCSPATAASCTAWATTQPRGMDCRWWWWRWDNQLVRGNIWYRAHEMGAAEAALTDIPGVDWATFGKAMGVPTETVRSYDDLRPAFERAMARRGPCLIDARVDKTATKPIAPWTAAVREWEDDH